MTIRRSIEMMKHTKVVLRAFSQDWDLFLERCPEQRFARVHVSQHTSECRPDNLWLTCFSPPGIAQQCPIPVDQRGTAEGGPPPAASMPQSLRYAGSIVAGDVRLLDGRTRPHLPQGRGDGGKDAEGLGSGWAVARCQDSLRERAGEHNAARL
jgi:hypothetical protein